MIKGNGEANMKKVKNEVSFNDQEKANAYQ